MRTEILPIPATRPVRMSEPLIVHVVGRSGSGKTTTIEYLTKHLRRLGFRVGVVKHVHAEGFTFDARGKNTWRHAEAGACIVIGVAPNELVTFKRTENETPFEHLLDTFQRENLDLVLVEGFSRAPSTKHSYKIVTAKNMKELKQVLAWNRPPILAITGAIASSRAHLRFRKKLPPFLDIRKNGSTLTSIIRRLLRPKELEETYRKSSAKHGGSCVGLAIGVRAAYLASNILGNLGSKDKIAIGSKNCIAEAFRIIYPKAHTSLQRKNDQITIRSASSKLQINLAPKRNFRSGEQALAVPDTELFGSINLISEERE
jgi:molybdopterin-guanine dinucleotide biosynthesis protein MobB